MDTEKTFIINGCKTCHYQPERIAQLQTELTELGYTVELNIKEEHMTRQFHFSNVFHPKTNKTFELATEASDIVKGISD